MCFIWQYLLGRSLFNNFSSLDFWISPAGKLWSLLCVKFSRGPNQWEKICWSANPRALFFLLFAENSQPFFILAKYKLGIICNKKNKLKFLCSAYAVLKKIMKNLYFWNFENRTVICKNSEDKNVKTPDRKRDMPVKEGFIFNEWDGQEKDEPVWSCRLSCIEGMTFSQAQNCEEQQRKILQNSFPGEFEEQLLKKIHHSFLDLEKLAQKCVKMIDSSALKRGEEVRKWEYKTVISLYWSGSVRLQRKHA